jgi:hypothetical protein
MADDAILAYNGHHAEREEDVATLLIVEARL